MILDGPRELSTKFYDVLLKNQRYKMKRILILSAADVDAVCALKILLQLFSCDLISYSLEICTKRSDIQEAMNAHRDSTHHVILINCGAAERLMKLLDLRDASSRIFVIDSRRPVHLENLYSEKQVMVLTDNFNLGKVPKFEEIYMADDDHEEEESTASEFGEDSQSQLQSGRKRKRRGNPEWLAKRERILDEYYKDVWYERSSALKMFDVAYAVSKDNSDLFLWGVLGLCSMHSQRRILKRDFVTESAALQGHVIRLRNNIDPENHQTFRITYMRDLSLYFYRHWSVFESLSNTPYTASVFRTWENRGLRKLYELLADMGFSLAQCKQNYTAMDTFTRLNMVDWFKEKADKHSIPEILEPAFVASYGFNQKFQVSDMALGLFACLTINDNNSPEDSFHDALDILEPRRVHQIGSVLDMGKKQLEVMRNIVQSAIEEKLFTGFQNSYFQASLDNISTSVIRYVGRPEVLVPMAHFLQRCYVVYQKGKKIRELPFVLIADIHAATGEATDYLHIVGLPPFDPETVVNYMGRKFDEAADSAKISLERDTFDSYIARILKTSKTVFLEHLVAVLSPGFRRVGRRIRVR